MKINQIVCLLTNVVTSDIVPLHDLSLMVKEEMNKGKNLNLYTNIQSKWFNYKENVEKKDDRRFAANKKHPKDMETGVTNNNANTIKTRERRERSTRQPNKNGSSDSQMSKSSLVLSDNSISPIRTSLIALMDRNRSLVLLSILHLVY